MAPGPLPPFPFLRLPGLAVLLYFTLQNDDAQCSGPQKRVSWEAVHLLPEVNVTLKERGFPYEKLSTTCCSIWKP